RQNVPVVQTLHNFRLICPTGLLYRNGKVCEACADRSLAWSVFYGCYRRSRIQSAAVASMLKIHSLLGTWNNAIDAYIALTPFMKSKLADHGLPQEKIFIKNNTPTHPLEYTESNRGYALFLGRLSREKGLTTLLRAWENLDDIRLKIAGDGPMEALLKSYAREKGMHRIAFPGYVSGQRLTRLIRDASMVIHSSECYEGFPVTIAQAFSAGKPVVASRLGAAARIVENGKNGLHFNPGDPRDLAAKVRWLVAHPAKTGTMGRNARRTFESRHSEQMNYETLMHIYDHVTR
ncbi:MAG: glycosyltransferase family 4 protein, partial [Desulfobacterales bacterium]|nr:glycosyltransferase family 4 protein [Desulfobacterales bacterium]